MTTAIAYGASGYTWDLAVAFARGCERYGVACDVRSSENYDGVRPCDVVWLYGLHYTRGIFNAYKGHALRVTGDLGYWRERAAALPLDRRPIRIAIDADQPDAHLHLRWHPGDRFNALGLSVHPVVSRGEPVLVTGHSPEQAHLNGFAYGQWEADAVTRLRKATDRPIVLRSKPGCSAIYAIGTKRCMDVEIATAIRKSWAVVCKSGNVGADAILHGVPVFAEAGPGAFYYRAPLGYVDFVEPLSHSARFAALSDIAYWQWTEEEIDRGELWRHLQYEHFV